MANAHSLGGPTAVAALGTVLVVVTTGCASSAGHAGANHKTASPRPALPAAPRPVSGYRSTAAVLAQQITGCDPHPLSPPAAAQRLHLAGARDLASAAACTLRGRTALILTFTDRAAEAAVDAQLRERLAYYATGPGWSAAPTDTSERVGQQSVVQDVALALDGLVETGGA